MQPTKILFLLLFSTSIVFSQDSVKTSNYALQEGKWALQFQIAQNFQLGAFTGGTISGTRHTSATHAQRIGVTLSGNVQGSEDGYNPTDSSHRGNSSDYNGQSISIGVTFLSYFREGGEIHPYLGYGPSIGFSRERKEYSSGYEDPRNWSKNTSIYNTKTLSLGASGLLGVEWFASQSISLAAEYSVSIVYSSSTGSTEQTQEDHVFPPYTPNSHLVTSITNNSSHAFTVGNSYVRFGLSAYF